MLTYVKVEVLFSIFLRIDWRSVNSYFDTLYVYTLRLAEFI